MTTTAVTANQKKQQLYTHRTLTAVTANQKKQQLYTQMTTTTVCQSEYIEAAAHSDNYNSSHCQSDVRSPLEDYDKSKVILSDARFPPEN